MNDETEALYPCRMSDERPSDGAPRLRAGGRRAALGLLLAASLSLGGCSIGIPEDGELFSAEGVNKPDASSLDGGAGDDDASIDAASGADSGADSGPMVDAGGDSASPSDGGAGGDSAQDAETVFDASAGLVVHYRFNETSGDAVHDFAGTKDALIVGTPSGHEQWVSAGRIDGALKLAGGSAPDAGTGHYVELPQGVLLGLDACSIALWVNRAGGGPWQRVFDLGSGTPTWIYFTANGATGLPVVAGRTPALIFVDYMAIPDAPTGAGVLKINKTIPVSTWAHFVVTWSATEIKVYLDGKLAGMATPNGAVAPTDLGNTGQNFLGRSQFAPDAYFDGLIDEFRIYNRVLSASDVAQLYEVK